MEISGMITKRAKQEMFQTQIEMILSEVETNEKL